MKALSIPAILMALCCLSLPACHNLDAEEQHAEGPHAEGEHAEGEHESHTIVVTSPVKQDVISTHPYVCQIHSCQHIEIRALEGGYLEKILVKEGQFVKKGDMMFKILPVLLQAKLDADIAEAQHAKIEYDNTVRLHEKKVGGRGVVSDQQVALAKANWMQAEAQVELAQAERTFCDIKAPFDGIVDRQLKQQGSLIEENDVLSTFSDNSTMWVYFNVPEAVYLDYMTSGGKRDPAHPEKLTIPDANIELKLTNGKIYDHSAGDTVTVEANFNNMTGNIAFRADFPNPDGVLRYGQTGTILVHRTLHDAIIIPQRAKFDILAKPYVYVVGEDNVVHQRPIVIQEELEDRFVISEGVDVNDKIIFEGTREVRDGDKIEYDFKPAEEVLSHLKYHAE